MKPLPGHVTPIFDGRCGFCTRSVRLLRSLDRDGRVVANPYQRSGTPEEHDLSLAQGEAAIWTVTPGTRPPPWLYGTPGIRQLQGPVYSLVARSRRHLPGDGPYCGRHPGACR